MKHNPGDFPSVDNWPLWGVVAVMCTALVSSGVAPSAMASDSSGGSGTPGAPVVGGFGLGDGVEGLVDERTGEFSVDIPVGGVNLEWSSQLFAVDRFGLGSGWGLSGVGFVDTVGGVRVFPSSGGSYVADASVPSGLRDYVLDDLKFIRQSDMLPARPDGAVGSRPYAYRLVELGGTVSYFSGDGTH